MNKPDVAVHVLDGITIYINLGWIAFVIHIQIDTNKLDYDKMKKVAGLAVAVYITWLAIGSIITTSSRRRGDTT